jgi:hypothetical protein
MRFFLSVIDAASGTATGDEMAAIDAFNDGLRANGHWVMACGVDSPQNATTVDNRSGAGIVTDGPFVNTTEYVAGFWIIDAPDRDAALELASAGSLACNRKVELRPFL